MYTCPSTIHNLHTQRNAFAYTAKQLKVHKSSHGSQQHLVCPNRSTWSYTEDLNFLIGQIPCRGLFAKPKRKKEKKSLVNFVVSAYLDKTLKSKVTEKYLKLILFSYRRTGLMRKSQPAEAYVIKLVYY